MSGPLPAPPSVVAITRLAKSVPGGRVLFTSLDLAVAPGEIVAIMGESGIGKSTLLNLIAGLDQADTGSIAINGAVLAGLDDDACTRLRRTAIGFVFQAFHILPHLTLAQNIALPLALARAPAAAALDRARTMLAKVGLAGRGEDYPAQLSGGELQRIAIARALIHAPPLILADEPTGNLDRHTGDEVVHLLEALNGKGVTLIVVTHDPALGARAGRQLVMEDGQLKHDSAHAPG